MGYHTKTSSEIFIEKPSNLINLTACGITVGYVWAGKSAGVAPAPLLKVFNQ